MIARAPRPPNPPRTRDALGNLVEWSGTQWIPVPRKSVGMGIIGILFAVIGFPVALYGGWATIAFMVPGGATGVSAVGAIVFFLVFVVGVVFSSVAWRSGGAAKANKLAQQLASLATTYQELLATTATPALGECRRDRKCY